MTQKISRLLVSIGGDVSGLRRAAKDGESALGRLGRGMSASISMAAKWGAAVAASVAASTAAMTKLGMTSATQLSRMSRQIGVATEDLGALRYAAQQMAGVAEGNLDMALRRMTRRIAEAADGGGPAAAMLKTMRLEATELARMSPDEQFRQVADAMSRISDQGTRLRATMALMDTEGMPLVNMLSQGADAIREMEGEAHRLGLTITSIDAAQVEAAQRQFGVMRDVVSAVNQHLAVGLSPIIRQVTSDLNQAAQEAGGMGNVVESFIDGVIRYAGYAANIFAVLNRAGETLLRVIGSVNRLFGSALLSIGEGITALASMGIAAIRAVVDAANKIPKVDISVEGLESTQGFLDGLVASTRELRARLENDAKSAILGIRDVVAAPLPKTQWEQYVENAREAARQAAEAIQGAVAEDSGAGGGQDAEFSKRLEALRGQYKTEQDLKREHDQAIADLDRAHKEGMLESDEQYASMREQLDKAYNDRIYGERERALESLREAIKTEEELEIEKYEGQMERLQEALEAEMITREEYRELERELAQQHEDQLYQIRKSGMDAVEKLFQDAMKGNVQSAVKGLSDLTAKFASGNRKMFEANKAFAIGDAIINTGLAVTKALSTYAPPVSFAMAAAQAAYGMAQVQSIRSQSFGGGGGAAPSVAASAPAPPVSPVSDGRQGGGVTTINLHGDMFGAQQVRDLIDRLNDGSSDGARFAVG